MIGNSIATASYYFSEIAGHGVRLVIFFLFSHCNTYLSLDVEKNLS